ncbi:acid protease [Trichodelitschia bisporula]|uniref:Probable aspartic-type endopeptidase OPSB n=1 Tax=Trichodelitschia bisporula TaxID=703511 RepID=A0A6G1HM98_9PEZI|nr:acid protease [Trichodelitschia bisporula]
MKLLLLAAVASVSAIQLAERSSAVLQLDTNRRSIASPATRDRQRLRKRTVQQVLDNESALYYANITLGTPAQKLRLDIDTGSSDIWCNSAVSSLCQQEQDQCDESGTFNANKSSSYQYVNSAFYIRYADGSAAAGDYAKDTLHFGGQDITGVQFGIGYQSSSAQGILGVGYPINEASIGTTGEAYTNLPALLVQKKLINTAAYSLWLNDLDANTGSILFGGVDTAKYQGDLQTLPIIKESGTYREFVIALSSISAAGQTILNDNPIPVLLDSGSSLSYLPNSLAQAIFTVFDATFDQRAGVAVVDCSLRNSGKTVDFVFSGVKISVGLDELVIIEEVRRGREICILGISNADDSTAVLGDTFLRSAYVVYDLSNNQISLAPTDFNATESSVKEIASGSSGVPGAKLVATAVSTLAVASGGARGVGGPTVTALNAAAAPTAANIGKVAAVVAAGAAGMAMVL